jgi:hypothetical protein
MGYLKQERVNVTDKIIPINCSGYGQVAAGTCEKSNEPSGSVKCGEFLD